MIENVSRRQLLQFLAGLAPVLGLRFGSAAAADVAADSAELREDDPVAKAVNYVTDAKRAKGANPGSKCATCALFDGAVGASSGQCELFTGKIVKASGWCSAWSPQI